MIGRLCIVGVGLIGGSLARALREAGWCAEITGSSRNRAHLETAERLGVIDRFDTDVASAVEGADLVVVAVPLGATLAVLRAMAAHLAPGAVVTDVGSAKRCVITDAERALGDAFPAFVPGHPIAGTERSGVEASFGSLFVERRVILTPTPRTDPRALSLVGEMWRGTGARVSTMDADHHDEVLAATSHLPHLLAYTLVDTLGRMSEREEIFAYAAGGFRDFTRIASSDPTMWRDICLCNRTALAGVLERFQHELERTARAVREGDREALETLLSRAKALRDKHAPI